MDKFHSNSNLHFSFTIAFLKKHNFDGFDIDFEFPGTQDKTGFAAWVKELKQGLAPFGKEVIF
jgi:GH18 family chitinase